MRSLPLMLAGLLAGSPVLAQDKPTLDSEADRASYALGLDFGNTMKTQGIEIDPELFHRGLQDALSGGNALLTLDEARAAILAFQENMRKKITARMQEQAATNEAEGQAFLEKNKSKEGVTTLPSGLQYEVLKAGAGEEKPGEDNMVRVHYTGRLLDGSVFDSSVERGQAAMFPLRGVIPGWTEILQLMTVGSKWRVVIPPELAYGERGAPPRIAPNAVLDFEIELLEINPGPEASAPRIAPAPDKLTGPDAATE